MAHYSPPNRILIIQLRQLGDILLTTPVLRRLNLLYPRAKVDVLTHSMGKLVLNNNPFLSRHWVYSDSDSSWKQLQLMLKLRSQGYDRSYDFMANPRSAIYSSIVGAREKFAIRTRRSFLYTDTFDPSEEGTESSYICREKVKVVDHFAERDEVPVQSVVGFEEGCLPELYWSVENDRWAQNWMKSQASGNDKKIKLIISPTHRKAPRKWPLEKYAEISRMLTVKFGRQILITWLWGPGEEADIDEILFRFAGKGVKAPKTNFTQMSALIQCHDLFLGNSNGPSHVAVAAGVSSLQLHGHTNGASWCPAVCDLPPSEREKVSHEFIQSTLYRVGIGDENLMSAISTDQVFIKLCKMIDSMKSV